MDDEQIDPSLPERTDISDAKEMPARPSSEPLATQSVASESLAAESLPKEPLARTEASIELAAKHSLPIRWMHWINFPILFTMIWSGLLIYWADSIPYQGHISEVYRIGLGSFTLARLFPAWFWNAIHAPFKLATGLGYHFFFMWIFAINGLIYVLYLALSGEWRTLVPDRRSFREAWLVLLHDLHIRRGLPPQRKYNGAQKIAYTGVVVMGAGSLVTGLAIYKPTTLHWLTALMGGYEFARWIHFWLTMGFCVFFVIHVGQVALAGWNNFRSMVSGYEIVPRGENGEDGL